VCCPRRQGSQLPVHLTFYCLISKQRFCSVLFSGCLQRHTDLQPQPFCPALLSVWCSSVEEQKHCKPSWVLTCRVLTTPVSGVCMEASVHHEPMGSPREVQFKFHVYFAASELTCLKLWKLQH